MKVKVSTVAFSKELVLRSELLQYFPDAEFNEAGIRFSKDELISFLKDADAAIIGLDKINQETLNYLPNLKIICKYGVGLDNIDIEACSINGVKVFWTAGVNKTSVAEMTLGFMLSLCRNLFLTSNQLKQGKWNKNGGIQLSSKTVGIIGVGNIGKEVIKLLKPFKCNILVNDIVDQKAYYKSVGVTEIDKISIFQKSDILTIHTPATELTKGLVNLEVLKLMKPTAFVINTARGEIINYSDLKKALLESYISGAAIDVYESEPPEDMGLIKLPNLICTPHIGGNAKEAVMAMGRSSINHLINEKNQRV